MKKLILSLCLCVIASTTDSQQPIELTAKFRGHYHGVLFPVGKLSNERLIIELDADAYGHVTMTIEDFEGQEGGTLMADWPFFGKSGKFDTNPTGIGDRIKGTFSAAGAVSGAAWSDSGVRYTFKAWRQYRLPQ